MIVLSRKKLLTSLLVSACVGLTACNGSGSGGGGGVGGSNEMAPTALENPVRLDSLGVLPAGDSNTGSYLLQIRNYSENKYKLDSVRVVDLDSGKDSKLVGVAGGLCGLLPSNGSCSLTLTPHTQKSADVKLEVKLKNAIGEITTLYQLVRVSGKLKATNGGIAMLNDVGTILTEDGNYGLSIPVVLGETFDDVRASNGSLTCNTAGYLKGSSCTYEVRGKAGKNGATVSTLLEGIRNGQVVARSDEATTTVNTGRGAYLLMTHGLTIDAPESTGVVRVFNSGNTAANSLSAEINPEGSSLSIDSNGCGTTLAAGDLCSINLSVSGVQNGQSAVEVSYAEGTSSYATSTNVSYTVTDAVAGASFRTESSNLQGAILGGKNRTALINVTNTSNRSIEDARLTLSPANSQFTLGVVADSPRACERLEGLTLGAGASCQVQVTYIPTESSGQSTINLVLNARYTDQYGQNYSLVSGHGLNYSASEVNDSTLSWSVIGGGNGSVITLNDGVDIGSVDWSLANTLEADENLPATLTTEVVLESAPTALSVALQESMPADSCGIGHILNGQESCHYTVRYGTVPAETTVDRDVGMAVGYTLNEHDLNTATEFKVVATDSLAPLIKVAVSIESSAAMDLTGDGITTPWTFTASSNNNLKLLYKYTNVGKGTAAKFNVDAGNLPLGAQVVNEGCPYGLTTVPLDGGGTCTLEVQVPDPRVFISPNIMGTGAVRVSDIHMGVSYYDESRNEMMHVAQPSEVARSVAYNRQWGALSTGNVVWFESATAYTAHLPVSVAVPADSTLVTYPIHVSIDLPTPIAGVTHTSCEVKRGHSECDKPVEITLPKSLFNPDAPLRVAVDARYSGAPESDVLRLITDLTTETVTAVNLNAPRLSAESAEFVEGVASPTTGIVAVTVTNTNAQPVNVVIPTVPANYTIESADCAKSYLGPNRSCTLRVSYDGTETNESGSTVTTLVNFTQANLIDSPLSAAATLRLRTVPLRVAFITHATYTGNLKRPGDTDLWDDIRELCNKDAGVPTVHKRNGIVFAPILNLAGAITAHDAATSSNVFEVTKRYFTQTRADPNDTEYRLWMTANYDAATGVARNARKPADIANLPTSPTGLQDTWTGYGLDSGSDRDCGGWRAAEQTEVGNLTWEDTAYYYLRNDGHAVYTDCNALKKLRCVAQTNLM